MFHIFNICSLSIRLIIFSIIFRVANKRLSWLFLFNLYHKLLFMTENKFLTGAYCGGYWGKKNTCVLILNSRSSEAKPRRKDGASSIPHQGHFQELLNWLLNFWFWSDEFEKRSKANWLSALSEATCIRHIGHRLMILYIR